MKKRRLFIATFISLITLTISSIGLSVAWYGFGPRVQVDNINIGFQTDRKLLLSTRKDAPFSEYKSELGIVDIDYVPIFTPVSAMFGNRWMGQSDTPVFRDNYLIPSIDNKQSYTYGDVANGGYYSQDVYIFCDQNSVVTLDSQGFELKADDEVNHHVVERIKHEFPELTDEEIFNNLSTISDCLRFSIYWNNNYWIVNPNEDEVTTYAGPLDTTKNGYYDTYNKNGKKYEFLFGEYYGEPVYKEYLGESDELNNPSIPASAFNAKRKPGTWIFDEEASLANGLVMAKEKCVYPKDMENEIKIKVKAYEKTRMNISIFIEGWDVDNTNLSMFAQFIAKLRFKVVDGGYYE